MKKSLLIVLLSSILLMLVSCSSPIDNKTPIVSQETFGDNIVWQKTFGGDGGDSGDSVQQTSDGGYIIAGLTGSWGSGNGDVYLIKIDAEGNELWFNTFGGESTEWAKSVQQTTDGGYIIAGATESFGAGNFDIYLIKTDTAGNELWSKTFGGSRFDDARAVRQTDDGGYIIVGTIFTTSQSDRHNDVYLIKTDANGNELWSKTFGGRYHDSAGDMQLTADGGYIIIGTTGTTSLGDSSNDIYLIKTDAEGRELWSKSYGGSNRDEGDSVWPAADGGYIIAGFTETPKLLQPFTDSKFDSYLVKTDSEGNELWSKRFGRKYDDFAAVVRQTADGGYIVLGTTGIDNDFDEASGVNTDIYLLKLDKAGNELWSKTYGGSESAADNENGNALEVTVDGGYIIAGLTTSYRSQSPAKLDLYDVYVIKTDAEGNTSPWGE